MNTSKLWNIFNDFEIKAGKICIGLSGGLDSRVLAGIISQRREIDLGFCFYTDETRCNIEYVEALVSRLNFKRFEFIDIVEHGKSNLSRAIKQLNHSYQLKDYTLVVAKHMDVITGLRKTKQSDRQYYYDDMFLVENGMGYANTFKDCITPLWNPRLVGYMQSLPRSQRLFQRAYRQMIREYLPELWEVPRCFETGKPVSLKWYVPKRIYSKIFGG